MSKVDLESKKLNINEFIYNLELVSNDITKTESGITQPQWERFCFRDITLDNNKFDVEIYVTGYIFIIQVIHNGLEERFNELCIMNNDNEDEYKLIRESKDILNNVFKSHQDKKSERIKKFRETFLS